MTKRAYVLRLLERIAPYWEDAATVTSYLLANEGDDEYVSYLYEKFTQIVDMVLNAEGAEKVEGLMQYLQSIKVKEDISKQADAEDIAKLEQMLQIL